MMVFNTTAVIQLIVAAIPGGLMYAIMHYGVGSESAEWWATLVTLLLIVPIDLLMRLGSMGGEGEDGEPAMGASALFFPSGGGHLMFLPMYFMSSVIAVLMFMGIMNP